MAPSLTHLFNSRIRVYRLYFWNDEGVPCQQYVEQPAPLSGQRVRLDPIFLKPGIRAASPNSAGSAPDRVGTLFANLDSGLLAGDYVEAIPNQYGVIPVPGTWEIITIPDVAVGYSAAHHIEAQIVSITQVLIDAARPFPGSVIYDPTGN